MVYGSYEKDELGAKTKYNGNITFVLLDALPVSVG